MNPPTTEVARAHPNRTLLVLAVGAVSYALAQTLIVPAIPAIQDDTGTSQSTATWLLTGFLLMSSVAIPLIGRMGDILGKEKVLIGSLAVFGLGSLVCALGSHSITLLILGRAIQGVGGAVFPLCFGIIRDEFPPEKIASSIGLISTTFGIGGGLGLVLAGVFVEQLSVAWMFWFSFAVTVVAVWATWKYVPESPMRVEAKIDWGGGAILAVSLGAILLAVSEGNDWGWTSGRVLGLFALGAVVMALFVAFERRTAEPMVDMKLMAQRAVWAPNVAVFAVGFAMFGTFILVPELAQTDDANGYGFGMSVLLSGLVLLPCSIVMLYTGPLSGKLTDRYGARLPLGLGSIFAAIAFAGFAFLHDSWWTVAAAGVPMGLGIGLAFAAMANLVVGAVPQSQTGIAMGINTIIRNVGGAVGGQVAAAMLSADTLGSGVPAESGYTSAFAMSAIAGLLALGATLLVPKVRSQAPLAQPATA